MSFSLSSSVNIEFWWVIAESYPGKRAGEITVGRPKLFLQDPSSVPCGSALQCGRVKRKLTLVFSSVQGHAVLSWYGNRVSEVSPWQYP